MGVTSFTQKYTCSVAPSRMFKALIIDSNSLLPKLLPQFIKSVSIIQGDGGVGTIEQVNFTDQGSKYKYVKNRLDELDEENLKCKYTMIEGNAIGEKLECIAYEVEFEPAGDGGCVCKMASNYHFISEFEIKEEEIEASKESFMGIYKVVENYLLDNPQVYT